MSFSSMLLPLLKSHYLNNLYFFFHVTKAFRVHYNFSIEKGQTLRKKITPEQNNIIMYLVMIVILR